MDLSLSSLCSAINNTYDLSQRKTKHDYSWITDFLVSIKQIADELTLLGDPPSDADLLVYATRGLGPAYKELITAMCTQDSVVPFKELFDKIIDHETFLFHNEKQISYYLPPTANLAKHFNT